MGTGESILVAILKLIDVYLKPIAGFSECYIWGWEHLQQKLNSLGPIPRNSQLFTANAKSMYIKIDTTHSMEVLQL